MPGEFEKEMQERMQDFRISPGPQVWKQVEAALPEEKRKRRFAFWWWLPLGLLIGGGIWYAVEGNKSTTIAGNEQPKQATEQIDSFKKAKDNVITATPVTVTEPENRAVNKVDAKNNSVSQTNNKVSLRSKKVPETKNENSIKSNEVLQTNKRVAVRSKKVPETKNEDAVKSNELLQTINKFALKSKIVPETNNGVLQTSNKTGLVDNPVKDEEPPVLQSATAKPNNNADKDVKTTADSAINALPERAVENPESTTVV